MRGHPNTHGRQPLQVAIIGSGFSGLCMAIKLKAAGYAQFRIFERAAELGGTWRDNTYPGCTCDVPSLLYSFSFAPKYDWSRNFAPWQEIREYLNEIADSAGLRAHLEFDTEITEVRHVDGRWRLATRSGEVCIADVVVNGTGPLNKPNYPALPGRETFGGRQFHSSSWDHAYDLAGKAVAVVGTGASAIQIVPAIAARVRRLALFQRTPPWVLPRFERAYADFERTLFRRVPGWQRLCRTATYWRLEHFGLALLKDGRTRRLFENLAHWYLNKSIPDAALRAAVTPDYRIGCKRVLISDDYYPSLLRPNVSLIRDDLVEIRPEGLATCDGRLHAVDAIIYGTGFRATDFVTPMRIYGRDGRELSEVWRAQVETNLGITVPGFPNFFLLVGPNTGLGHNSIIFMIEAQVHYVMACVAALRGNAGKQLELKPEPAQAFSAALQARLQGTAWLSGCKSWYLSADGRNYTMWPGSTPEYWLKTRRLKPEDYQLR